ncbi:MAG: hypothetical protein GXX92_03090 [Clostridiales bacterium]|nr:hypothetical protein [Clostridiales bacterium]
MKLGGIDRRLAALEERARPRILVTLADFVLWRAKWRRGIEEEVELDPVLEESLREFTEHSKRRKT